MRNCEFNIETCTCQCSQYPMCSLKHSQEQIRDIETRVSFLLEGINTLTESITKIYEEKIKTEEFNKELKNEVFRTRTALLEIITNIDSYAKARSLTNDNKNNT